MLLLPSLRGGEWNTEPEWHLERSARTMLDFSVKIQQRWLNMAVQNRWQYYEDMTKDFMRGIHVQMSLRKPQTNLMATKTTSLAGFWFSKFAKIVIKEMSMALNDQDECSDWSRGNARVGYCQSCRLADRLLTLILPDPIKHVELQKQFLRLSKMFPCWTQTTFFWHGILSPDQGFIIENSLKTLMS